MVAGVIVANRRRRTLSLSRNVTRALRLGMFQRSNVAATPAATTEP